jgi:tetratricopeptide (TPR) repeat protein
MALLKKRFYLYFPALVILLALSSLSVASSGTGQSDSLQTLYNNLGVIEALNGNTDIARDYLDSARIVGSEDAAVLNNSANCLLCLGEVETALNLYDSAYSLAESDKRILFNWSLALYVMGKVDESVEKMREFLISQSFDEDEETFISMALQDLPVSKAEAAKLSKEEIRQLLQKAKARLNKAIEKKKASDSMKALVPDSTVSDSLSKKKPVIEKKTTPAGEKAVEPEELAPMLHWIIK